MKKEITNYHVLRPYLTLEKVCHIPDLLSNLDSFGIWSQQRRGIITAYGFCIIFVLLFHRALHLRMLWRSSC